MGRTIQRRGGWQDGNHGGAGGSALWPGRRARGRDTALPRDGSAVKVPYAQVRPILRVGPFRISSGGSGLGLFRTFRDWDRRSDDQMGTRTRCRSLVNLARPYVARLINLRRLIGPSV